MFIGTDILGQVGLLSGAVSIIVEVLKHILPDTVPTKIVTIIVSLLVSIAFGLVSTPFSITNLVYSIFGGFVVAYTSMFGFDQMKDIYNRVGGSNGE